MVTRAVSAPACEPTEALAKPKSRRKVLRYLMSGSVGAVWMSFVYPLIRYLIPPAGANITGNEGLGASVTDLKPNSAKTFRFGNHPALLIRLPDGKYQSMSAICTHLGCTVQYQPESQQIWCPCHNGRYDLQGRNVQGPPPRPLVTFDVKVHGEEIHVSRRKDA